MDLPNALIDDLTLLSDALDDPVTDLQAVLDVLADDLAAAVPSYLGLTVTLYVDGNAVVFSTLDAGNTVEIRASLLLPLAPLGATISTGSVIFYSGADGAFIDLADDARWIFNLNGHPVLDAHLPSAAALAEPPGIRGLADLGDINQAVGMFVEEGLTPPQAHTELRRRAIGNSQSLPAAARQLLRTFTAPEVATES